MQKTSFYVFEGALLNASEHNFVVVSIFYGLWKVNFLSFEDSLHTNFLKSPTMQWEPTKLVVSHSLNKENQGWT